MISKRTTQIMFIGKLLFCLMFAALLSSGSSLLAQDILDISAGATAASGSYAADKDFSGGTAAATATTVSTTGVTNPAPEAVYQNQRYGNFTYTLPGFTSGTTYLVRLHMDEFYWTAAGKRTFNVLINGTQVLTNFDIFATAGGEFKATVQQFNAVANSSGQIVIQFVSVVDNAAISGIEVQSVSVAEGPYPGPAAAAIPGTVLAENYDTGGQGTGYSVSSTNGTANTYRAQGVDLEVATAPATGNNLGWTAAGQWFRYTVNAATAGTYTVSFLVAAPAAVADGFHLSNSSGTNLSGSVNVPATGTYQTWVTVTASVTLPAGTQTLTVNQDNGLWNIDSMAFASGGGGCTTKPNAPAGLAASGTSSTGTTLNWTADTAPANCSISSYTVLKNGASIGTATGTSFAVTGLTASTNYSFTVEATDAAGTSAASSAVSVTTSAAACTTTPSAPTGLAASGTTSSGTTLNWTADTAPANCSISSYTVLKNGASIGTATGTSFAVSGLAASTNYSFTVEASDAAGTSAASSAVSVTTLASSGGEAPYPGPAAAAIPGTVMAENYDTGGQGVAYNVTSTNGTANTYRTGGVDLEAATAPATGNDLGWSAAGQWFRYTVNAATAGTYTVSFLVAGPAAIADAFHLSNSSGTNLTGSVAVPATGGYQTWVTVTATATLPAGTQTLTLNDDAAGWNIDSIALQCSSCGGEGPYPGPAAAAVPGTVLNENYDTGGQGVAYNVTSTNGTANTYRAQGVDLEAATAPATGNDLGWSAVGQWFRYTVNASTAGSYTVSFLVASPAAITDAFHLSNASGTNLTGSVNVPATGGYQTWVTVTATATLPAGTQTLTLNDDAAGWNIDSMAFATGGGGCTTKPNAPAGLVASGTSSSGTNLSWATDSPPANCSISSYTILKNGASIGTATGTSFAVSGLTASTNYSFTVEATDAAGTSAASSAVSVTTSGTGGGGYVPIANAGFTLTPQNATGLLLDNSNWGIGAGNPLDVLNPNGSVSQAFALSNASVTPAGDYNFGVQGANCMTASGTASGSAVVITGCGGTPAQAWQAVASGIFYTFSPSTAPGLCLTASGTGSGNAVVVDTCNGSSSQKWGLTAVVGTPLPPPQGPITNGGYSLIPQNNTGLMLDDSNSGTGNGNPINVTTPASSVAQNWALSDNGVTPLTYYNLATIGAFCMDTSGTTSGSAVVLDGCAGLPGQAWEAVASGSTYAFHPASNTALCLTASGTASGSAVVVDTCNGSSSQQWGLGPIAAPGPPGLGSDCSGVGSISVGGRTYNPSWCTEFNGAAGPAPSTGWAYDLGNNGGYGTGEVEVDCGPPGYATNPVQCPASFSTATAPVYIDGNGHLVIQPRLVGGTWLSGRLITANSAGAGNNFFQYGIIEVSVQLQDLTNQGLWPAFWGMGENLYTGTPWPNCGETDILEDWSPQVLTGAGDAGENSTIHTQVTSGTGITNRYLFPSGQAVNTGFHTYGMIWSANEIQYFVDNPSQPFATLTPSSLPAGDVWPFNQPIFLILNEAIGGILGGTPPASTPGPMLVDYVRYYQ